MAFSIDTRFEKRVIKAEANKDSRITLYFFNTVFKFGKSEVM